MLGILLAAAPWIPARAAEPVMVRCGREYQAARTAGTLNGMDWNAYRISCAQRLKTAAAEAPPAPTSAGPEVSPAPPPAAAPAPAPAIPPPAAASASPVASGGMTAEHAREKQCGAEWRAEKAKLIAQTPGLTWPKYWSQCNRRLKAGGG